MSEEASPERIAVNWSPEARTDLRAIDRETAIQILHCIDRYLASRTGDVKMLKPRKPAFVFVAATTESSSITRTRPLWKSPLCAIDARLTAKSSERAPDLTLVTDRDDLTHL